MGLQLSRLRSELGNPSQEKLATEISLTQGTLSKYLHDEAPVPLPTAIYISKKYKKYWFLTEWLKGITDIALNEYQAV